MLTALVVSPLGSFAEFAPAITQQPQSQSVFVAGNVTFTVMATGTTPLNYQWFFNGTNLTDGLRISGSTNPTLTISNVLASDAGNYTVRVTNVVSSVLSSNAVLTVSAVLPGVPYISNFSPGSGAAGTTVTISGQNFSPIATNNLVWFGAVAATVLFASTTNLVVTVPTGATCAPITVNVAGLVAYAYAPFVPTFVGDGSAISTNTFGPRLDLASGSGPIGIAVADLDGDGKPDLVVANTFDHTISLFRNTSSAGTVSFAPRVDLPPIPEICCPANPK